MDGSASDAREIRAARNQAMFRIVNEKLTQINQGFVSPTDSFVIACECADPTCVAALTIDPAAYRSVRAHPRQFALLPGHASAELENVVVETDHYVVAETFGEAALVVEKLTDLDE